LDQKSILGGNFVLVFSGLFLLRIYCVVRRKYLVAMVICVQGVRNERESGAADKLTRTLIFFLEV
jgi:hypothetical protein